MTEFTVLIHTTAGEAVAAHRPGSAWGRLEATLDAEGVWTGVPPFEVQTVSIDEDRPVDTVPLPCSIGVLDVPWDIFRSAV